MMIENIDFRKLLPYRDDKKKSFELLCYHLAKREYEGKGALTPVDDSGGGDGVEFYLTQTNKEVIGWQAKFFQGTDRLKDGGRKAQIAKSLIKACEVHPNLTEWYLCTPSKFTVEEQLWFDTELIKSLPGGLAKVPSLKRWTSDDITSFLSKPKFNGLYQFFFGELELDINWFRSRFAENFSLVEAKYDEDLHTVNRDIYRSLNSILLNEPYLLDWDSYIESIIKKRNSLKSVMDEIGNTWVGSKYITTLLNAKNLTQEVLIVSDNLIDVMKKDIRQLIKARDVQKLSELSLSVVDILFDDFLYKIDELRDPSSYIDDELGSLIQGIRQLQNSINSSRFNFKNLLKKQLHIIGEANQGKTHLICHYCKTLMNVDNPLLFIPAVRFSNATSIEQAVLDLMDVPSNYGFDDFLNALDEYAEVSGKSLPIFIEGLNESTIRFKGFSSIWRTHLSAFTSKIAAKRNLVLITTCRPEYAEAIWPTVLNEDFKWINGFSNPEEAILKYFKKYRLKADLSFSSLEHFRNPIYLKMFCEAKNPKAQNRLEIDVSIGEENLLEVFELYINELSKSISQKYALPLGSDIVQTSLLQISSYLWENNERAIPFSKFHELLGASLSQERTVGEVLIDESVLFIGNYSNKGESVGFTYDLMAGYLIAKQLILQCTEDVHSLSYRVREGFLFNVLTPLNLPVSLRIYFAPKITRFINSELVIKSLFSKDQENLHPLYQDIRKSIALLIPINFGRHLHQISYNPIVFSLSISTLFDLHSNFISNDDLQLVEELFANNNTRKNFYKLFPKTLSLTTHPLNSVFLFKLLSNISMADRDITWTTYLTTDSESTLSHIDEFEKILNAEGEMSSAIMFKKKQLVAKYLLWYLASSNREIRDSATKALYSYGAINYPNLMQLTFDSLTLNDPYIFERALASLYGATLANFNMQRVAQSENITIAGRKIFELMFALNAPYSTTHILAREYGKQIVEIALLINPSLLSTQESELIKPPYKIGGIRNWNEVPDEFTEMSRSGPIHMDFGNYTIGRLVTGYDPYSQGKEKVSTRKKIYWRLYDLGYDIEKFKSAEEQIRGYQTYSRSTRSHTERFGKKYSWIAFYELAGFRDDAGLLDRKYYPWRLSDMDIDPTFPLPLNQFKLIDEDFLGDRKISINDWIENGGVPNVNPYLVNSLKSTREWVMLDGFHENNDVDADRKRFTFFRTLLVKKSDSKEVLQLLRNQDLGGRWLPEISENTLIFADEMATFPKFLNDDSRELQFITGVTKKKIKIDKDTPRRHLRQFCPEGLIDVDNDEIEIEEKHFKNFNCLLPVTIYAWQKDNEVNNAGRVSIPGQKIIEYLNLKSKPQTFNLLDSSDIQVSQSFKYGSDNWNNQSQHFTFMRKDYLDRFLNENDYDLIWCIWGERDLNNYDVDSYQDYYKKYDSEPRQVFQEIISYTP